MVNCATTKDVSIIALTGASNDYYQGILTENDIEIQVPSQKESHLLESHLFIINTLCELIDHSLFGQK